MKCKKCNLEINSSSIYCPYCGEKVNKNEYDDPFKNLRITGTHDNQYNYQKSYSSKNNNDLEIRNQNNFSLIGLILGLVSIPITFINYRLSFPLVIFSLILVIIGKKHTTKTFGNICLISAILTFVISIILSIFMFILTFTITFTNGYRTSFKDYIVSAFYTGYYQSNINGYWINDTNQVLRFDDGNYFYYLESDSFNKNYYYGLYKIEDGIKISDNQILYGDDNYYYYTINTSYGKVNINNEILDDDSFYSNGFYLKLSRNNKRLLILEDKDGLKKMTFYKK